MNSSKVAEGLGIHKGLMRRRGAYMALLCGIAVVLAVTDLAIGPATIEPATLWRALFWAPDTDAATQAIVWQIRLPQALMAVIVGASLGLAGAEMQTVLDNPLACPFTLGVSSAAALGAAVTLVLNVGFTLVPPQYMLAISAFTFAVICSLVLDLVARKARIGSAGVVLFGIALVFTFNALLSLIQFSASASALQNLFFWMMGSLARTDWMSLAIMACALAVVLPWSLAQAWKLTSLRFGEERATSFGVNPQRLRRLALLRISVLASLAVAFVGVIGFIGLVAPHIARRLFGEDHRWYLPASAIIGAIILAAASVTSKLISSNAMLPVGIVTTLVGVSFFLVILMRRRLL